jgi:uncharacterized protein YdeI (YjbR/CyaY-like superfamily)
VLISLIMTATAPSQAQQFYAEDRKIWRGWLLKNHTKTKSVWLILYHKDSGKPSVSYDDAVEEALCFGWIDSKPNKRNNESSYLFFSPRNPKSNWSKKNRERAERMISAGLMTGAGMEMITLAKNTGRWTALEEVQDSVIPPDLKEAFTINPTAEKNFSEFPSSSKRIILEWILNAKKPETRQKRIEETVQLAEKNIKANHYRQ